MPAGVRGSLLTRDFIDHHLPTLCAAARSIDAARAASYRRWHRHMERTLGPASPVRSVLHECATPLAAWLGFHVEPASVTFDAGAGSAVLCGGADAAVALMAIPWGAALDGRARDAARRALSAGHRWALLTNGRTLRLLDATRPWAHQHLDFDLAACRDVPATLALMRAVCEASAFQASPLQPSRLAFLVVQADRQAQSVCSALSGGVRRALEELTGALVRASRRSEAALEVAYPEALTAVYRLLFLLFAESRCLVPAWHAIYREAYTLEALVERLSAGGSARGVWAGLQALARLAHAGATAGDLRVTAFNGRLFAPGVAPRLDHLALDDDAVARALLALAIGESNGRSRRIAYGDLGVEQLGSVYEHLLDYAPQIGTRAGDAPRLARQTRAVTARKATGTFYTPRAITDYLVRQTLAPLVAGRSADDILRLRVVDPAMGSGAFLVAACRFLASAYEAALIDGSDLSAADLDEHDRAAFRRQIASRCLFGVDLNPMAVQLARLSLWLTTLAADRPLSFLDHHLIAGNSLVGASPVDLARQPPGTRPRRNSPPPLLSLLDASGPLASALPVRRQLAETGDDSLDVVRWKEQALAALRREPALDRWRTACDLWCAAWWQPRARQPALHQTLIDLALGRARQQGPTWLTAALTAASGLARTERFCHWPLEFPEVFLDSNGCPAEAAGFDAVLGNPPWEMIREDPGGPKGSSGRAALLRFVREAGVYTVRSRGHVNQFQLFVERALSLARPGARIGLVVPGAVLADDSCAALRQRIFDTCRVEALVGFENRKAIFPIHRSVRFVLLTATTGARTAAVPCRLGETDPEILEQLDSTGGYPVVFTRALLERLSGGDLAVPDVRTAGDLALTERLHASHAALGSPHGWAARFGRELNASDDRDLFAPRGSLREDALPVIGGRQISPFRVDLRAVRTVARRDSVRRRLGTRASAVDRWRLAYRDVAAASNRVTLIAALLPAGVVSVHTVFCLRNDLPRDDQDVLCTLLNSYVSNYLVRQRVSTHVTTSIVERLPVPRPPAGSALYGALARLGRRLRTSDDVDRRRVAFVEAQALSARAFDLTSGELARVLDSFPLVEREEKQAILRALTAGTP